jgi:uncharacterized protein (DUF427 family)
MVKAIWNGKVIAEADRTEIVEVNHYFPSKSLREEFFRPSDTHTICPWKGKAHYCTLLVTIPTQSRRRRKSPAMLPSGKVF